MAPPAPSRESITIRDVPDEASRELAARAAATGRSLQEYLRSHLIELARRPDPEVLMVRVRERKARTGTTLSRSAWANEATVGETSPARAWTWLFSSNEKTTAGSFARTR